LSPSFSVDHKSGLSLGFYATDLFDGFFKKNTWDEFDISLSYIHKIMKKINGGISYTRLFFNSNTQPNAFLVNDFNVFIKGKWWIKPKVYFDYSFGRDSTQNNKITNNYSVGLSFCHDFVRDGIFTVEDDDLTFSPKFSFTYGTVNLDYNEIHKLNLILKNINNKNNQKKQQTTIEPIPLIPEPAPNSKVAEEFKITSYTFTFPIAYNYKDFSFEVAFNISISKGIPSDVEKYLSDLKSDKTKQIYYNKLSKFIETPTLTYFTFSLYYSI
jgi:hypothetical protein